MTNGFSHKWIKTVCAAFAAGILFLWTCAGSVPARTVRAYTLTYDFDTQTLTDGAGNPLPAGQSAAAEAALTALLRKAEALLDPEKEGSDVYRVNAAKGGETVSVDPMTVRLFLAAKEAWRLTGGAFDPALYPLVKLWGFVSDEEDSVRTPRPEPDEREILRLLPLADFSLFTVNEADCTVVKRESLAQVGFGGIVKGFLLDEWRRELEEIAPAAQNALLTIMSSSLLLGKKTAGEESRPFRMGVKNPRETGGIAFILSAENVCLSTSGDYERYYEYEGKRYGHILSKTTGRPCERNVMSVSAVVPLAGKTDDTADSGAENDQTGDEIRYPGALSDAFSTALSALSLAEGEALAAACGVSALVVGADYRYYVFGDLTVETYGNSSPYSFSAERPDVIVPRKVVSKDRVGKYLAYGGTACLVAACGVYALFRKRKDGSRIKKGDAPQKKGNERPEE